MMSISVIIPTLNRPKDLKNVLNSVLSQTILPNEIIIIDQSRDDLSKLVCEELLEANNKIRQDIVFKYIKDCNVTGLAQARNEGIKLSCGNLIFFFDDDVILERNYLHEILNSYEKYPHLKGVQGVITNYSKIGFFSSLMTKLFTHKYFRDQRLDTYCNLAEYKKYDIIYTTIMGGGLMSIKREVFDEYKFDENFYKYSFGEDVDFSYRVSLKYKMAINPAARLYHKSLGPKLDVKKQIERQICFYIYFFKKNIDKNLANYSLLSLYVFGILISAVFKILLRGNFQCFKGVVSGFSIVKNNFYNCDFIKSYSSSSLSC